MKTYVIARYRVSDFVQFKNEFDSAAEMLPRWGVRRSWLDRNLDDPQELLAIHECDDVNLVRAFYESDEYKECLDRAGAEQGELLFVEELAAVPAAR